MVQKAITINSLMPLHKENGIAVITTDFAARLLSAQVGLARSQRKALNKLLGEDSERIKAHVTSLDLYGLFDETKQCGQDISEAIDVDRLTAFRTLFLLPGNLVSDDGLTSQSKQERDLFYMATSLWMVSRELCKNASAAKILKRLSLDKYEPYARVCSLRYDMIRRMCELDVLPIQNPNAAWLVAEAANCIHREMYNYNANGFTSKRSIYKGFKSHVDTLQNQFFPSEAIPVEEKILLSRFSKIVEGRAKKLSSEEPLFKEQYLTPYVGALRAWNSFYYKRLSPSQMKGRRPGPKIGRRYAQC